MQVSLITVRKITNKESLIVGRGSERDRETDLGSYHKLINVKRRQKSSNNNKPIQYASSGSDTLSDPMTIKTVSAADPHQLLIRL